MGRVDPGGRPPRPPGRSGRAQLRHPAPQITGSLPGPLSSAVPLRWRRPRCVCHLSPRKFRDLAPPSLHGVPPARFPRCSGTMRRSDSLPPFLPRFSPPVATVPPLRSPSSLPWRQALLPTGLGFAVPVSPSGCSCGNDRVSQVPGEPLVPMPCSPTPMGPPRQAISALRCCLPLLSSRRLP